MKTPIRPGLAALFSALVLTWNLSAADGSAASDKAVAAETHEGYFVSNKFEPDAPMSFVIAADQAAFDKVFGVAMVMRDRSHRLPPDVFGKKIVVAAIHRGKAMVTYKVESVNLDAKTIEIRYAAKSEPSDSAEFSCPLILSVPKGGYDAVRFIENGKAIKTLTLASGSPVQIRCERPDSATVAGTAEQTVVTIRKGNGIGGATLLRGDTAWPQKLIVRAHLGGLEQFAITSGDVRLSASVLSHSGNQRLLHIWRDGKEGPPLKDDSKFWMEIRTINADGKPVSGLPPKGGYFELTIPNALLDGAKQVELAWIDFYR